MTNETKQAYVILSFTAIATAVFHFLFLEQPSGWPFAAFVFLITLALIVLRTFSSKPVNAWAYAFLPPAILTCLAQILFANPVVHSFGFLVIVASLVLFAYWLFAPKTSIKQAVNFWPQDLIAETLAPVGHGSLWHGMSFGKSARQVLIGLVIAVPFVMIFLVLFMSADALVSKVLGDAFHFDNPAWFFLKLIFDVVFAAYLSHFLWTTLTRTLHKRQPRWVGWSTHDLSVAIAVFLATINLLFLGFIAFQFVYFFGGQSVIEAHGLTYASYAREGFFQLFTVSVLVFGLVFGIAWYTRIRTLAVRLLSLGLVVQSWIVIASGIKRLSLYVDAYGLSVLRFWALAGLVVVALGLLALAIYIAAQTKFESLTKVLGLATLYVAAGFMLVNVENIVVRWNAARLPTESVAPDLFYPYKLSSDAMPVYVEWLKTRNETEKMNCKSIWSGVDRKHVSSIFSPEDGNASVPQITVRSLLPLSACTVGAWKTFLHDVEAPFLRDRLNDPLVWTLSDARALEALESLK
jgi:hypothetical protein